MPFDVFISHSSADAHAASAIKQHLQAHGLRCWKAPDDVLPGENWPYAIARAINGSSLMIVIWSCRSASSRDVAKELTLAMNRDLIVIPVRIENVAATGEMEYHLANTHWMDALEPPIEMHFEHLLRHVMALLPERAAENRAQTESVPVSTRVAAKSVGSDSANPKVPAPEPEPSAMQVGVTHAKATQASFGKKFKILAIAAAVILIVAVGSLAVIFKTGGDKPVTPKLTSSSYDQVNLANMIWLVPGAEFTLLDRDGVVVVNKTTIPESAAPIFKLNGLFTEAQWKRSAPHTMEVVYRADNVCDMRVRIEGIAEDRFSAEEETPNRLNVRADDLTASIKGWFSPRFVPVFEDDTSGINESAPITFADGDPIKTAIQYPAGAETKTTGTTFKGGKFEFECDGATGVPQWVVTSSLFSKEVTLPLQPPFTTPDIPLSVVEVSADPGQIGVLVDGLILRPMHEAKSPLWQRINSYSPVLTSANPKAKIVEAEDYGVIIFGGPLDGLSIAKVNASTPTPIELPAFNTGYAFGLNPQTPYEVDGSSNPRDAAYLLTMPKDEPWRAVIVCYDKGLNDGAGGFHITENIMRAKSYDPATKRVHFNLDFEGQPFRRINLNLRKVFQSASLEFPINWKSVNNVGFTFPATAVTKGRDQKDYEYQFPENGFEAIEDGKTFVHLMQTYFIGIVIHEAKKDGIELTPEMARENVAIPDANDLLGKNAFNTDAFKVRIR